VWKRYIPDINAENARSLHSEQALPAQIIARFWPVGAMSLYLACAFAILFDIWFGGPIWRLGKIPAISCFFVILSPVAASFQNPVIKLLRND
jgi:hypothetical protein